MVRGEEKAGNSHILILFPFRMRLNGLSSPVTFRLKICSDSLGVSTQVDCCLTQPDHWV